MFVIINCMIRDYFFVCFAFDFVFVVCGLVLYFCVVRDCFFVWFVFLSVRGRCPLRTMLYIYAVLVVLCYGRHAVHSSLCCACVYTCCVYIYIYIHALLVMLWSLCCGRCAMVVMLWSLCCA